MPATMITGAEMTTIAKFRLMTAAQKGEGVGKHKSFVNASDRKL
jgi:hypothetical protein